MLALRMRGTDLGTVMVSVICFQSACHISAGYATTCYWVVSCFESILIFFFFFCLTSVLKLLRCLLSEYFVLLVVS